MTRTTKVTLISIPSVKGYSRWVWRAVECEIGQTGKLTERGVVVLWQSRPQYRPTTKTGRGQGPEAYDYAEQVAEQHRLKVCGLVAA